MRESAETWAPCRLAGSDADGLAIWLVHLDEVPAIDCLSEDERMRAAAAIDPVIGERYRAARRALRLVLSAATGQAPADLLFSYGTAREPHLAWPPDSDIDFSLSYRDHLALIAVSRAGAVGVDLEHVDPAIPAFDIAASEFATSEVRELAGQSEAELALRFTQMWVRKEAVAKMTGEGLWQGLANLPAGQDDNGFWHDLRGLPPDYAGAYAIRVRPVALALRRADFTQPPDG